MKMYLVLIGVFALFLAGCGKGDDAQAQQAAPRPMMSSAPEPGMMAAEMAEPPASMMDSPMMNSPMMEEPASMAEGMTVMAEADTGADGVAAAMENPDLVRGKQVYDMACFACHALGIAGAPLLGDQAAWAPRIAQGMETLVDHSINGFQGSTGVMPPKGGRVDLSDEDIVHATAYMVGESQ